MKRKQRYIRILCMIFVLSLLLSACSKPPAPAERDTDEPSTVAGSNSGSNSTTEEQPQDTAADAVTFIFFYPFFKFPEFL